MLREEYAHLVGKEEFDEIYQMAVGKGAPAYSFLTILPHEQDEKRMFLARMDKRLYVEDSEDEDSAAQSAPTPGAPAASGPPPRPEAGRGKAGRTA